MKRSPSHSIKHPSSCQDVLVLNIKLQEASVTGDRSRFLMLIENLAPEVDILLLMISMVSFMLWLTSALLEVDNPSNMKQAMPISSLNFIVFRYPSKALAFVGE